MDVVELTKSPGHSDTLLQAFLTSRHTHSFTSVVLSRGPLETSLVVIAAAVEGQRCYWHSWVGGGTMRTVCSKQYLAKVSIVLD